MVEASLTSAIQLAGNSIQIALRDVREVHAFWEAVTTMKCYTLGLIGCWDGKVHRSFDGGWAECDSPLSEPGTESAGDGSLAWSAALGGIAGDQAQSGGQAYDAGRAEQAAQAQCRRGTRKLQVDTPLFAEVRALMNRD